MERAPGNMEAVNEALAEQGEGRLAEQVHGLFRKTHSDASSRRRAERDLYRLARDATLELFDGLCVSDSRASANCPLALCLAPEPKGVRQPL